MASKRHAKPTAAQLINRLYRQSLAREKDVENQLAILRLDTQENTRILKEIVYDSKEAREDNIATLPSLRRAIEKESQGSAKLRATARTLVDHCARLLREKETLQKRLAAYEALENAVKVPGTLWKHTYECNIKNTLRLGRGELPQCNCGAAKWRSPA